MEPFFPLPLCSCVTASLEWLLHKQPFLSRILAANDRVQGHRERYRSKLLMQGRNFSKEGRIVDARVYR